MKTSRALQSMEVPLSIPYQQFALIRFVLVLGFICHGLACRSSAFGPCGVFACSACSKMA